MILEDSIPQTVSNKHMLLQSGNSREIQHLVLNLPIGLLFLDQWHNTCKVTNSTTRIIQEPISAMKTVKALPRWDKHVRVLWPYVILCCYECHSYFEYDIGNLTCWTAFLTCSLSYMLFYLMIRS